MTDHGEAAPRWSGATIDVTTEDGVRLCVGHVPAANGAPRARIVLTHGIASHMGWYEDVAQELASRNYEVYVPDRRGSGQSAGSRGHAPSWQALTRDLSQVVNLTRRTDVRTPVHALGVSLGAVVAVATQLEAPGTFDALFLATPAVDSRHSIPLSRKLTIGLKSWLMPRSQVTLPFGPCDVTPCDDARARVAADAMRLRSVSARMGVSVFKLRRFVRAHLPELRCPVGLLFAEDDQLVDNDRVHARFSATDAPRLWVDTFEATPHFLHDALPADVLAGHVNEWITTGASGNGPSRRTTRRSTRSQSSSS